MDNARSVIVFDEKAELESFVIKKWNKVCAESISKKGFMTAALSGGSTPVGFYRALAAQMEDIPWGSIHLFFVDERFVPFTDKDSNFGLITRTLLNSVPIPIENLHPVATNTLNPNESAEKYEEELIHFFRLKQKDIPQFDLILLGIGEDGHTASLFPGSPALNETSRLISAVILNNELHDRITMTIPVINHGRHIIFLVEGVRKAVILRKILMENGNAMPASQVKPLHGDMVYIADREAAGLLPDDCASKV